MSRPATSLRIKYHNVKIFESLEVFELSLDLAVMIHEATRAFPREELYGMVSQMRRASISVISNIAEGQGRLTNGEWRQFLGHSRGSLFELEAQCIAALRLKFMTEQSHADLRRQIKRTCVAMNNFIDFVQKSGIKPRR